MPLSSIPTLQSGSHLWYNHLGGMRLKRMICLIAAVLLCCSCMAGLAELRRNEYLDVALSMLEEGNPFLTRYNQVTESSIQVRFPQGIPYFSGGQNQTPIFAKYPEYTTRKSWLKDGWQLKDENYIYGFDSYGFVNWVWGEVNGDDLDPMDELYKEKYHYERHIWCRDVYPYTPFYEKIAEELQPGDLFVSNDGANHVMLYIGTLRDYGYEEERWPKLAAWLDYPLVIHSQYFQPACAARFAELIKYGPNKYRSCKTTQGGVTVSLLYVPVKQAEKHEKRTVNDTELEAWYFKLEDDTLLTLVDTDSVRNWCWYREP